MSPLCLLFIMALTAVLTGTSIWIFQVHVMPEYAAACPEPIVAGIASTVVLLGITFLVNSFADYVRPKDEPL